MKKFIFIVLAIIVLVSCGEEKNEPAMHYTVTFETDGGTPVPSAQNVEAGGTASAPSTNPSKTGYVFLYWQLTGATGAYNFQLPVNSNITLTAKWQVEAKVEYWQVTWELNGGTWSSTADNHVNKIEKGGVLNEPYVPEKSNCIFEGWYKEPDLSNKIVFPYIVSGNLTLYAKWEIEEDHNLINGAYDFAYTILITEQYKKGLRPGYIENESGETILYVAYTSNKSIDYLDIKHFLSSRVIYSSGQPILNCLLLDKGRLAVSALLSNSYDYAEDPASLRSCFWSFTGSSVFGSLENFKLISNNDNISDELYKKIVFPNGCYKLIIFSRKNGKTYGKYVGYSTATGDKFNYWIIDPDHPNFGESYTMSIPK